MNISGLDRVVGVWNSLVRSGYTSGEDNVVVNLVKQNSNQVIPVLRRLPVDAIVPGRTNIDGSDNVVFAIVRLIAVEVLLTNSLCSCDRKDGLKGVCHLDEIRSTAVSKNRRLAKISEVHFHEDFLLRGPSL